ncbi:GspH/FimT family pseudopilin [Xenophilus azovorans]|uniref:GspH/FimT family pseudopilin n=1 Tax=Xenophilus azovorans TaxID=151755 RepID=UPI00068C895E|nr:GspH/FimT family pseudopilin [Xenophilus azovorans]
MLTLRPSARARAGGFTLVELMVTITLLAILLGLAMPPMLGWVRDSKVRAVSETLQSGLREAQSEALRRSRQVVFSLTDDKPTATDTDVTAKEDGNHWAIHTLPSMTADENSAFVGSGVLTDVGAGVTITGPAALCFNSLGRVVANSTSTLTGVTGGATCAATDNAAYEIGIEGGLTLRVLVALGGQVRLCDPRKTLSNTHPDGCPSDGSTPPDEDEAPSTP